MPHCALSPRSCPRVGWRQRRKGQWVQSLMPTEGSTGQPEPFPGHHLLDLLHPRPYQTQEPFLRKEALAAMGASTSKWPHGYWPLPENLRATWDPPSRRLEAGATSLSEEVQRGLLLPTRGQVGLEGGASVLQEGWGRGKAYSGTGVSDHNQPQALVRVHGCPECPEHFPEPLPHSPTSFAKQPQAAQANGPSSRG